jgi:hypothetical protein
VQFGVQALKGLYCVGDSCFPGQGVNAVAFSGMACAHRVAADIGKCEYPLQVAAVRITSSSEEKLQEKRTSLDSREGDRLRVRTLRFQQIYKSL